jgi:hypothetical protein
MKNKNCSIGLNGIKIEMKAYLEIIKVGSERITGFLCIKSFVLDLQ